MGRCPGRFPVPPWTSLSSEPSWQGVKQAAPTPEVVIFFTWPESFCCICLKRGLFTFLCIQCPTPTEESWKGGEEIRVGTSRPKKESKVASKSTIQNSEHEATTLESTARVKRSSIPATLNWCAKPLRALAVAPSRFRFLGTVALPVHVPEARGRSLGSCCNRVDLD